MKKTNKLMALLVVLAMLASMMSFTATVSAEDSITSVEVSQADIALSVKLKTLGVITNEFVMSNYVTRGQMASIAAKYANVPASASGQAFKDVTPEHPYFGAIGALYNMGVVTGDENGNFNPDAYVTYDEVLVFVINAVGHKPFAQREGGYPTGYHRIAIKHGMLEDLSMKKGTDKATLADIYRILDKGLTAATVVTQYYGDGDITYTLSDTETFLSDTYKIKQYRGVITGIPGTRLTSIASDIKDDQIEINNKRYDLYGYPEFSMLGYSVDFYVSSEEPDVILHIEETKKKNSTTRIDAEDLLRDKTTDTRIYYSDDNDKEYHIDLDANFSMIYNNQYFDMYGVLSRVLPDNGYIEALDNNNDGVYDTLFVYTYRNVVVDSISSDYTSVRDKITGNNEDLSDDDQVISVYYNGSRKLTTDSIMLGDVLSIVESKQSPVIKTVYITRDIVVGKIEEIDSVKGCYIDGEWYRTAVGCENLTLGLEGSFYLDMNSDIACYERDMTNRKGEIAIINGMDYELGNFTSKIGIRVYTKAGDIVFLNLKEKVKVNGKKYDLTEHADAVEVLTAIATDTTGGNYKVGSAYAISYVENEDGEITELDLGSNNGPGTLNVKLSKEETNPFLVRNNNILYYKNSVTGLEVRQRINPKNSWVVSVPDDEEIDDFERYRKYSLTEGFFYGPSGHSFVNNEYVISSFDIYSFEETDYPMVDVIVLRGLGGKVSGVSQRDQMDVIVELGSASTEDGEITPKLYMANNEYILAPEVKFPVNGTYETISSADLLTGVTGEHGTTVKLEKGMAVQYALNNDEQITAIRFVAKWDDASSFPTPLFKAKSVSGGTSYVLDNFESPTEGCNIAIGTVDGFDFTSRQIYFHTPDKTTQPFFLYQDGEDVLIYNVTTGKVSKGSSADIVPGDIFVTNVDNFYTPQTFVIFR